MNEKGRRAVSVLHICDTKIKEPSDFRNKGYAISFWMNLLKYKFRVCPNNKKYNCDLEDQRFEAGDGTHNWF